MGSKRSILNFVVNTIDDATEENNKRIYDLFGGSAVVSGSFRNKIAVTCNDIQSYTAILAGTYLNNYNWSKYDDNILDKIVKEATNKVLTFKKKYYDFNFNYDDSISYKEMLDLEKQQQKLLTLSFNGLDHLFVKNFSGTYWSYDQCVWIDAISSVARSSDYKDSFLFNIIMSSLMFAMAYTTQSTGHYAQYRDITKDNLSDILFYRKKNILPLFKQKFSSLKEIYNGSNNSDFDHKFTNLDYGELLKDIEENSIVYADPPYQFVHYSRFYHALETLVKYDYPEVKFKGRYRTDRHQSPFCIKTKVKNAFSSMFQSVFDKRSTLVLSYSDTGMITLDDLINLAGTHFRGYIISIKQIDYKHSTMGRQKDKNRDVKEALLVCKAPV
ncbi:DNA adenine methylase [Aquimarina sp. ERC-38]|uniref:DNA adenine methylase n=1 Tax=Aquimarina sp. ERC-38 TaxID=2949996 RepID=UPI002248474E|nr:DNA adenine methylase [Aquimarina sp. ERC-38]UZO80651.1 DNA adenine methylase [Aquimarina sp. ERC-38]UZO80665.1 DNA adenine methylase [Aquimarina sp. ERC-38]